MVNVVVPKNNESERRYIFKTLLNDYLGIDFNLVYDENIQHYSLKFDDCELIIKDYFFGQYPEALSYLKKESLPSEIIYASNKFTFENDIPVIYGSGNISVTENKVICELDIFASCFFMLTRWEEYVNTNRDEHQRFLAKDSIAYKNNFLHRPVVNEYVEFLWNLLVKSGFKGERKKRSYELVLTHDIDQLDYPGIFKIIAGDIVKRRNIKLAQKHFNYFKTYNKNPYDTFDFMMTVSEKLGVKSRFYFMSSDSKKWPDNHFYVYTKRFEQKIKEIKERGHIIGFHPGYYTCDDMERWAYEKQLLEKTSQGDIIEGRQHYLMFKVPDTFRLWDKNDMQIDSTMGYADHEGFRCGTGDVFNVYDFLEQKELRLRERPLIIMDGNLVSYGISEAIRKIKEYIHTAKKYNSVITILFHNTTFYGEYWNGYDKLYTESLGINSSL
ncbi:polysaccharide deacetylase family protein [Saccharicrinis sp. 156]|uniref:polysaccharide deacetylase family protein n=1 Tax=Saccharicrinis sp. 156 TaxID=3417574 RepID=UPI003D330C8E